MGDGRWEMGDGRWDMGDGIWEMGDGRWEMGDGRWVSWRNYLDVERIGYLACVGRGLKLPDYLGRWLTGFLRSQGASAPDAAFQFR